MDIVEQIAEAKIREAVERGDLDDLPGAGKPLALEDGDPYVAPELRMAYRILKNAGYLPEEVRLRREIAEVEDLLMAAGCEAERARASRRLHVLLQRLGSDRAGSLQLQDDYYRRLNNRLAGA